MSEVLDQRSVRLVGAVLLIGLSIGMYSLINGRFESAYDFGVPVDDWIPFVPWTLPIYMSIYLFALVPAMVVTSQMWTRGAVTLFVVSIVSYAAFIAFPAEYPRPELSSIDGVWRAAYAKLHAADPATNTFPSLHVGTTVALWAMIRKHRLAAIWTAWAMVICISTLTTKQHFVLDVAGGAALAFAAGGLVDRWFGECDPGETE